MSVAPILTEQALVDSKKPSYKPDTPQTKLSEFTQISDKKGKYVNLHDYINNLCKHLKEKFCYYNMNGCENIWLLKPGSSSRGRGIKIYRTYERFV